MAHIQTIEISVVNDKVISVCLSGGVEMKGLKANIAPRRQVHQNTPVLEEYHFVPFNEKR